MKKFFIIFDCTVDREMHIPREMHRLPGEMPHILHLHLPPPNNEGEGVHRGHISLLRVTSFGDGRWRCGIWVHLLERCSGRWVISPGDGPSPLAYPASPICGICDTTQKFKINFFL